MRLSMMSGIGLRAAAVAALVIGAACYDPSFQSGSLKCGGTSAAECPEGHVCSGGYCYKKGAPVSPTAGTGGGGTSGMGGAAGTSGGGDLYGPFEGCAAASSGRCDVVCQAGCGSGERCNLDQGNATCRAQLPPFKGIAESCGSGADTCRPGSICLEEVRPQACGAHCYRFCRDDTHCPANARCASEVLGSGQKVCSPPFDPPCNPVAMGGGPARCQPDRPNFGCYVLSASHPDLAVCDCAGDTRPGAACTDEHECQPGFECVKLGPEAICRKVCHLSVAQSGCPIGMVCAPFMNGSTPSTKYGFCRAPL